MLKTQINRLLLAVVLFNLCAVIGCHRGYYRRQADAEAKRLIGQKSLDPRWDTASGTIEIDPQSRMFDPFSADHPPIPPDDLASNQFMYRVDGKEGYPHWHANGDTSFVENPEWQSYLPVNEKGEVVLTLSGAFQLALIHAPDYQAARETLYLSALDVSLDRFGFDTQLFTGYNGFFTSRGRFRGSRETGQGSSSTLQGQIGVNGGGMNFQKLGITGTTFAVGLANTILFNFSGNSTQSATSLVDFSIIQPLLRGAGRDRILEALTQSERTLLANVRQLERFKRAFYLQIAVGRGVQARLRRAGDFLGLPGFAGTNAGGFFGLLEQQQRIRNQELNVRQLEAVLELFREFFLRERLQANQLKRFETSVYREQRTLLTLKTGYQTTLDQFKVTLGLPPDLDVVIDNHYLDQFKLISDQINERLILAAALRQETGAVLNGVDNLFDELETVDDIATGKFVWPTDLADKIDALTPFIEQAELTLEKIVTLDREEVEADFDTLDSKRSSRIEYLTKLKTAIESGKIMSPVDPGLFETDSLPDTAELRNILASTDSKESVLNRASRVKQELADIKAGIAKFKQTENELGKTQLYQYVLREFQEKIPGQLSEINNLVLEISLLQASTRSNSIEIIDVEIESAQAIEIARCMRRDWMNARASLVDSWRNIEFVADQLEAQVDLVFEGDIGNTGSNPFKLRYETGQLRAGFRFDAPIVRMSERNNYREALINYQQTRRSFYQFEDSIKQNLREIKRNIDRNKVLIELDRRTVQTSIDNVEINRYELEKPVGPNAQGGGQLGANTAETLSNAIITLNRAQDSFLGSWVEYEVLRRNLDFDLGTMQLDEFGEWIDPGQIDASIGIRAAAMMGIDLDCQFCTGVVAPLGFDPNLNFLPNPVGNPTPPAPLQFESNSPTPAEIKRDDVPETPQLNRPESGMRLRRSVRSTKSASVDHSSDKVPSLLFSPVKSRSVLTAQMEMENRSIQEQVEQAQAKQQLVRSETFTKPFATASSSKDAYSSLDLVRRKLKPTGLEPKSTDLLVADRISNQFSRPVAKQTSAAIPLQQRPTGLKSKRPAIPAILLKTDPDVFRPVPPLGPIESTDSTSEDPPDTKLNTHPTRNSHGSSLGGVLNRFRTGASK